MNPQTQVCRLATIKSNRINLNQEGLDRLTQFDFLSLATLQGNLSHIPPLINSSNGYEINPAEDSIWISKYPYFSSKLKRYIVLLRISVNDQRSLTLAHAFCCLLSNVILVANPQSMDLRYLVQSLRIVQQKQGTLKTKVAALIGLSQSSSLQFPNQNFSSFSRALESQGLSQTQITAFYPYISGYQFPQSYNSNALAQIIPYLEDIMEQGVGNTPILTHGEIIKEYAENLSNQFNSSGSFNPSLAQDNIEVDQYFEVYMEAVERYNLKCKNTLGNQPQANIQAKLQQIRSQTEQQQLFQANPFYAKKIQTHMDRKQTELTKLNEQFNDTYNINLLQKQSSKSLEAVTTNKNVTQEDVTKEIDRIIKKYNEKSRGTNSQKLLSQFLQVFVPTIYSEAGVSEQTDKRIKKLANQNQALQTELRKLQKKNSRACCSVM